jgi:type II secretory pathway pseudopilin PulG
MAALLVALAVMGILMSVALPVWKHDARRAKEAELVWRGQQYVRAIRLYSAHMGGALPPSIDALVTGHYLRKPYKDPITNADFQILNAGGAMPGQAGGTGTFGSINSVPQPGGGSMISNQSSIGGAVIGVVSKSKDESILVYQGRTHYNEWTFTYVNQQPTSAFPGGQPGRGQGQPGVNGPGRGFPGGRGRGFPSGGRGFPGGRGFGGRGPGGQ